MPGGTPAEAVNNYLEAVGRALSCVTTDVASVAGGYFPAGELHELKLARRRAARVRTPRGTLDFGLVQGYAIVELEGSVEWEVAIREYSYLIESEDGHELLAFHLHGGRQAGRPHIHLGSQLRPDAKINAHIPSGIVLLADVVRFLIADMGVRPLRADWQAVLE